MYLTLLAILSLKLFPKACSSWLLSFLWLFLLNLFVFISFIHTVISGIPWGWKYVLFSPSVLSLSEVILSHGFHYQLCAKDYLLLHLRLAPELQIHKSHYLLVTSTGMSGQKHFVLNWAQRILDLHHKTDPLKILPI